MRILIYALACFMLMGIEGRALENSIVPTIEAVETGENLPLQKYTKNQLSEIMAALEHKAQKVRFVTFNMLANDVDDRREEYNRWPARLPRIVAVLQEMAPDVIGSQELYKDQLEQLLSQIGDTYGFFGEERSDGELNGVLYLKSRWEILETKVWTIPSTGKLGNNVTMVQLKDKYTGSSFAIFNAHLAFPAEERENEVCFILEKVKSVAQKMPVVFTGDLNTFPNRRDLNRLPYYDGDYIHRLITKEIFKDSADLSLLGHLGPISTFTNAPEDGIPFRGLGTPGVMLDHLYVTKDIEVLIHAVQPVTVDGCFPSDHMPVIIDVLLKS